MKTFDPEERLQALIRCRDFHSREVEDYSARIQNFPRLEPEYDNLPNIPEECDE